MIAPQSITCSCGEVYNAKDANGDINPAEVKTAVENLINSLNDASTSISTAIRNLEPDAGNAVKQNETKTIVPAMEETCDSIDKTIKQITSSIESENLYSKAEQKHDEYQTKYNNEAIAAANACAASHEEES